MAPCTQPGGGTQATTVQQVGQVIRQLTDRPTSCWVNWILVCLFLVSLPSRRSGELLRPAFRPSLPAWLLSAPRQVCCSLPHHGLPSVFRECLGPRQSRADDDCRRGDCEEDIASEAPIFCWSMLELPYLQGPCSFSSGALSGRRRGPASPPPIAHRLPASAAFTNAPPPPPPPPT